MYLLTRILPPALRPYAKAVWAFLVAVAAVAYQWVDTGVFNDPELRTAVVGLVSSLLVYSAPNTAERPLYDPRD